MNRRWTVLLRVSRLVACSIVLTFMTTHLSQFRFAGLLALLRSATSTAIQLVANLRISFMFLLDHCPGPFETRQRGFVEAKIADGDIYTIGHFGGQVVSLNNDVERYIWELKNIYSCSSQSRWCDDVREKNPRGSSSSEAPSHFAKVASHPRGLGLPIHQPAGVPPHWVHPARTAHSS